MNKCARCGEILAGNYETVHVMDGELYCSKECAIEMTMVAEGTSIKAATRAYDMIAEEVRTEDILNEDFRTVAMGFSGSKIVKIPNNIGITTGDLSEYVKDNFRVVLVDKFGNELEGVQITMAASLVRY